MPERCIERHREHLASFQTLLIYTDTDLLDTLGARAECRDARLAEGGDRTTPELCRFRLFD